MRRAAAAAMAALLVAALQTGATAAATRSTYALAGEARALELGIAGEGLSLGFALARVDSKPSAMGVGAAQCELLGDDVDPDEIPCNESTTAKTSYPGDAKAVESCGAPQLPAPLNTVLDVDIACGSSVSALAKGFPVTTNGGEIADIALSMDVTGVIPQVEDLKEQLIDQLQQIIDQAPEPIKNALNQIADALDEGQAGRIQLEPASSNVAALGSTLEVTSSAAGARIGLVGIPDLDKDGIPIPGTSDATTDGLIIIEVGSATATASVDTTRAQAKGAASPAVVVVKVRDITQAKPTYVTVPVAPGQTVTILEGTPAESTITAAASTTEQKGNSAAAAADAVRLHLLKGVSGGIELGLGRVTAAARGDVVKPQPPIQRPATLPQTGGRDVTLLAAALLLAAAGVLAVRRRIRS